MPIAIANILRRKRNKGKSRHERRVGNYCLEGEIKRGGMGRVRAARHCYTDREVAIKTPLESSQSEIGTERFVREARLASRLSHPNTIQVLDLGRDSNGMYFYAMEFLKGMDLQELVERFGPLLPERVVFILRQVCGSLAEMHHLGIVHRDIKPANIFLTNQGGLHDFVKVLDFGLAENPASRKISIGSERQKISGSLRFISPETLKGDVQLAAGADFYGLGGLAYWMLTGRPPFADDDLAELIRAQLDTKPASPSRVSELQVPADLDEIVLKCLAKDPQDRYSTAKELRAALESVRLENDWNWERAENWWRLHGLLQPAGHAMTDPDDCG